MAIHGPYRNLEEASNNIEFLEFRRVSPVELMEFEGDVYYDPRRNGFIQLRKRRKDNKLAFSYPCEYYEDAKTSIGTRIRPARYLRHLIKIKDIKKFNKARWDGIGWRIKGVFKENLD